MLARLFQNITHPNYACVFKAGNSWCVTCRKTFRSPIYYYKRCSSSNNISSGCTEYKSPESHSSGSFISIYRLPQMPIVSTVCRLRVTAGVLFPAHLPILYALVCVGWVPQEYLFYFFGVAAITLIKLWFLGKLCTNVVGFVYASQDMSTVKIAYLDYLGRRKDDIFPVSDLVPFSELPSGGMRRFYIKCSRYSSSSKVYKLNFTHGQITDKDKFCTIFGKVD